MHAEALAGEPSSVPFFGSPSSPACGNTDKDKTNAKIQIAWGMESLRNLFEEQKTLSVADALSVIHCAQDVLQREPNLVEVRARRTYVIGDLHGQFFDLIHLMEQLPVDQLKETNSKVVFLGDYVDRGAFSCEVILLLLLWKVKMRVLTNGRMDEWTNHRMDAQYPQHVFLLRGNHECETISTFYGFRDECRIKYGVSLYYHFLNCFQQMPLAALIKTCQGDLFCVHGGLSPHLSTLDQLQQLDRQREPPNEGPLCDLLWSDPLAMVDDAEMNHETNPNREELVPYRSDQLQVQDKDQGALMEKPPLTSEQEASTMPTHLWTKNPVRGCSYYFAAEALFDFLKTNDLLMVIRAHEFEEQGFCYHFGGDQYHHLDARRNQSLPPLITVFSAPNYCDKQINKGAFLVVHDEPFDVEICQLESVRHPLLPMFCVEKASDLWMEFRRTLPFIPASKDFFEDILAYRHQHQQKLLQQQQQQPLWPLDSLSQPDDATTTTSTTSDLDSCSSSCSTNGDELQADQQRRETNEMHPQALRRVLDEEASRWIESDLSDRTPITTNHCVLQDLKTTMPLPTARVDRSHLFTKKELEQIKLVFTLLDTDGSMTLSTKEIQQFVFNILGEQISTAQAQRYTDALDYDGNGLVDFSDLISWVAFMKTLYEKKHAQTTTTWSPLVICRVLLWLVVAWLARSWLNGRISRTILGKKPSVLLRLCYTLSLAISLVELFRWRPQIQQWATTSWKTIKRLCFKLP